MELFVGARLLQCVESEVAQSDVLCNLLFIELFCKDAYVFPRWNNKV